MARILFIMSILVPLSSGQVPNPPANRLGDWRPSYGRLPIV